MHQSPSHPGRDYCGRTSRLWEIAVGDAVAVFALHLRRIPTPLAVVVGWVGLAAALASGFLFNSQTTFPGYAALLPVLGTAAVVAVGPAAGAAGPVALLGLAPLRKLGDWSYSLYLWHWPFVVFATAKWGPLTQSQGLAVVALSFLPALLAFHFVEEPARTAKGLRTTRDALRAGGVILLSTSTAALVFLVVIPPVPPATAANASSGGFGKGQKFGAQILAASPLGDPAGVAVDDPGGFTPQPGQVEGSPACGAARDSDKVKTCEVGDRLSSVHVVLVGDSHAAQWATALADVAAKRHWRLTLVSKDGCPYASVRVATSWAASCETWNKNVTAYLTAQRPAVLIASQTEYGV